MTERHVRARSAIHKSPNKLRIAGHLFPDRIRIFIRKFISVTGPRGLPAKLHFRAVVDIQRDVTALSDRPDAVELNEARKKMRAQLAEPLLVAADALISIKKNLESLVHSRPLDLREPLKWSISCSNGMELSSRPVRSRGYSVSFPRSTRGMQIKREYLTVS